MPNGGDKYYRTKEGGVYKIPADNTVAIAQLKKEYPDAQQAFLYEANGAHYVVPESDTAKFKQAMPTAKALFDKNGISTVSSATQDQQPVSSTENPPPATSSSLDTTEHPQFTGTPTAKPTTPTAKPTISPNKDAQVNAESGSTGEPQPEKLPPINSKDEAFSTLVGIGNMLPAYQNSLDPTFRQQWNDQNVKGTLSLIEDGTPEDVANNLDGTVSLLNGERQSLIPFNKTIQQMPASIQQQYDRYGQAIDRVKEIKSYLLSSKIATGDPANALQQGYEYLKYTSPDYYKTNIEYPQSIKEQVQAGTFTSGRSKLSETLFGIPELNHQEVSPNVKLDAETIGLQANIVKGQNEMQSIQGDLDAINKKLKNAKTTSEYNAIKDAWLGTDAGKKYTEAQKIISDNQAAIQKLPEKYPYAFKDKADTEAWQKKYDEWSTGKQLLWNIGTGLVEGAVHLGEDISSTVRNVAGANLPPQELQLEQEDLHKQMVGLGLSVPEIAAYQRDAAGNIVTDKQGNPVLQSPTLLPLARGGVSMIPMLALFAGTEGVSANLSRIGEISKVAGEAGGIGASEVATAKRLFGEGKTTSAIGRLEQFPQLNNTLLESRLSESLPAASERGALTGRWGTVALTSYGQYRDQAKIAGLSDKAATAYAVAGTLLTGSAIAAGTPIGKINEAVDKGFVNKVLSSSEDRGLLKAFGAKATFGEGVKKVAAIGVKQLASGTTGALHGALFGVADQLTKSQLNGGHFDPKAFDEIKSSAISFALMNGLMGARGGIRDVNRTLREQSDEAVWQASKDPGYYNHLLDNATRNGDVKDADAAQAKDALTNVINLKKSLDNNEQYALLNDDDQKTVFLNELEKERLQEQNKTARFQSTKSKNNDRIAYLTKANEGLIGKTEPTEAQQQAEKPLPDVTAMTEYDLMKEYADRNTAPDRLNDIKNELKKRASTSNQTSQQPEEADYRIGHLMVANLFPKKIFGVVKGIDENGNIVMNTSDGAEETFKPDVLEPVKINGTSVTIPVGSRINTFEDNLGKEVTYNGEKGILKSEGEGDGERYVVETPKKIYDNIGNANDLRNNPIESEGIHLTGKSTEPVAEQINIADDGSINIGNKKYVNPNENPIDAISLDENNKVNSVTLETEDGRKRTFRGERGLDIATKIITKKVLENEKDFENFINEKEEVSKEINNAGLPEATEGKTGSDNAGLSERQKENLNIEKERRKMEPELTDEDIGTTWHRTGNDYWVHRDKTGNIDRIRKPNGEEITKTVERRSANRKLKPKTVNNPEFKKTIRKIGLTERYNRGKEANVDDIFSPGMRPHELWGEAIEKSQNPAQIASIYKSIKDTAPPQTDDEIKDRADESNDPVSHVLLYFAQGGKINPSSIKEVFGGGRANTEWEKRARIGIINKRAPSIDMLAHKLMDSPSFGKDNYGSDSNDIPLRNAIINFIQNSISSKDAMDELRDRYATSEEKGLSQVLRDAKEKFELITGIPLTKEIANVAHDQYVSSKVKTEDYNREPASEEKDAIIKQELSGLSEQDIKNINDGFTEQHTERVEKRPQDELDKGKQAETIRRANSPKKGSEAGTAEKAGEDEVPFQVDVSDKFKPATAKAFKKIADAIQRTFSNSRLVAINVLKGKDFDKAQQDAEKDAGTRFNFIGEQGAFVRIHNELVRAKEWEKAGISPDVIYKKTGWYRDAHDKKWRYELPQKGVEYTPMDDDSPFHGKNNYTTTLGELLKYPDLYRAYPELKDIRVSVEDMPSNVAGHFDLEKKEISINGNTPHEYQYSALRHEIQHYIQQREGFAQGASPEDGFRLLAERIGRNREQSGAIKNILASLPKDAPDYDALKNRRESLLFENKVLESDKEGAAQYFYKAFAGEIEARNVQKRIDEDVRKSGSPNKTSDKFPQGDVTIRYMSKPDGTVYGFVHNNRMYINGDRLNLNTPFHEAAHIFTSWAKDNAPDLYRSGLDLTEGSKYLDDVKSSDFYRKQAENMKANGMSAKDVEDFYKDEALAKAVGDSGEKMNSSVKEKFKSWLRSFWDGIRNAFGKGKPRLENMSADDISKLSLGDYADMVAERIGSGERLHENKQVLSDRARENEIKIARARLDDLGSLVSEERKKEVLAQYEEELRNNPVEVQEDNIPDGSITMNEMVPFARKFLEMDVLPQAGKGISHLKDLVDGAIKTFSPLTGVNERGKTSIFKMLGRQERETDRMNTFLKGIGKMFDKMDRDAQIKYIDAVKEGETAQLSPELDEVARLFRALDDKLYNDMLAAGKLNNEKFSLPYLKDHLRVWWKVKPKKEGEFDDFIKEETKKFFGVGRRPSQGTKGQLKAHSLPNISEGLERGGVPVSYNPVELFKLSYRDGMKYITAQKMWKEIGDLGLREFVRFGKKPPFGFSKINDNIAKVYFNTGKGIGIAGEWYVEDGIARLLNRHFSRDLVKETLIGRDLLNIKNHFTAIELGLSPFHFFTESLEVMGSQFGLGWRKAWNLGVMQGNFDKVIEGVTDMATFMKAPADLYIKGRRAITAGRSENADEYLKSNLGKKAMKGFVDKEQYKQAVEDYFDAGGKFSQNEDFRLHSTQAFKESISAGNYMGAALRSLPALNETLMNPLFETYIPALKMGLFMKEYPVVLAEQSSRIEKGFTTREEQARKLVKFIDDRLGETNFDTMFWDRTAKSATQFFVRSITWKLGNLSAIGGAPFEQAWEIAQAIREKRAPLLMPKMAWLFGLALTQATIATLMSLVFAHHWPDKFLDLLAPRVSESDEKERVTLPLYTKEVFHVAHSPGQYVKSSLAGQVSVFSDLIQNKDFLGYEIYDKWASLPKQVLQGAQYAFPKPFGVINALQAKERGYGIKMSTLNFVGFPTAPAYLVSSPIEQKIFNLYHTRFQEIKPYQQKEGDEIKKRARNLLIAGDTEKAETILDDAIKDGILRKTQADYLMRNAVKAARSGIDASVYCFRELPTSDKQHLYDMMTDEEKGKYSPKGRPGEIRDNKKKTRRSGVSRHRRPSAAAQARAHKVEQRQRLEY